MACTRRTPCTRTSSRLNATKPSACKKVPKKSTKKKEKGKPKSSPSGKDYSPPVEKKNKDQVARMLKGKKNLFNVREVSDNFVKNYSSNTKKYNSMKEKVKKYFLK